MFSVDFSKISNVKMLILRLMTKNLMWLRHLVAKILPPLHVTSKQTVNLLLQEQLKPPYCLPSPNTYLKDLQTVITGTKRSVMPNHDVMQHCDITL